MRLQKTRYEGRFKVHHMLDLKEPMNYMQEMIFIFSPPSESWEVSTRRLLDAIRDDGNDTIGPVEIWYAYRCHKELQQPINYKHGNAQKWTLKN